MKDQLVLTIIQGIVIHSSSAATCVITSDVLS